MTPPFSGRLPNCLSRIFLLNPLSSFILVPFFFFLQEYIFKSSFVSSSGNPFYSLRGVPAFRFVAFSCLLLEPRSHHRYFQKSCAEVSISGCFVSACVFSYLLPWSILCVSLTGPRVKHARVCLRRPFWIRLVFESLVRGKHIAPAPTPQSGQASTGLLKAWRE